MKEQKNWAYGVSINGVGTIRRWEEGDAESLKASPLLDKDEAAEQRAIQHQYVDDLIDQNGVSTRVFVKEHGVDFVRRFFHEIFFGV